MMRSHGCTRARQKTERLQATSATETNATANGIQCAVSVSQAKRKRRRERERGRETAMLFPEGPCAILNTLSITIGPFIHPFYADP